MIFNKELGMQQAKSVLHLYSGLQLYSEDEKKIVLVGTILVNRSAMGFTLCEEYGVKLVIPVYSDELPYAIDISNRIDKDYPHRYADGRLCLETDTAIRVRFVEGFSLPAWMSEYVETYFFSYEYYKRYGEFPFGERRHGLEGIFQTYEELFAEQDTVKIIRLMRSIIFQPYRGHMLCPCGSEKKLRSCHGSMVMNYYLDDRLKTIVQNDYKMIEEVVKYYYEQQRNSKQTK